MSANRSVQAAQRRRAGPPEPAAPGRGPQPSINSSQMFAAGAQPRMGPGSGQVSGRLAGQQAQQSQKQMMEQQSRDMQSNGSAISSINKMTLAQAITLITLRLGKVETQMMSGFNQGHGHGHGFEDDDDHIMVDKGVIQSLISRIDALEKKPLASGSGSGSGSTSNQDVALLKQQFETIKPIVVQSKNSSVALKQQIESLRAELFETKELVTTLQNLTMDNSTKILAFNSIFNSEGIDNAGMFYGQGLEQDLDETVDQDLEEELGHGSEFDTALGSSEIMGTNLKELIENELNANS